MFTFRFATLIDALSWALATALAVKLLATLILMMNKEMRDRPGWGSALWWVTKVSPVVAVLCFVGIAFIERDKRLALVALPVALFVGVSVPLKISQRRRRIAERGSGDLGVHS